MKIILSRKGFDYENGGIASPIFEDRTLLSFPIPSQWDYYEFEDLEYKGKNCLELLNDLKYRQGIEQCHFDPDLDETKCSIKRPGWEPAFGPSGTAHSYLKNNGVEVGDLFLFFGTFHFVEEVDGHYRYVKKTGDFYKDNDLHIIWGYMQVGEMVSDWDEIQRRLYWHPHAAPWQEGSTIYTAPKVLTFDKNKPGAGLLTFDKKRVLTLEGATKATWKKNAVYDIENIKSKKKNSAKDPSIGIYYKGIWQELVLAESDGCTAWAKSMIE